MRAVVVMSESSLQSDTAANRLGGGAMQTFSTINATGLET